VIIGARNEKQLHANIVAIGWELSAEHVVRSMQRAHNVPAYPYRHQREFPERNRHRFNANA